MIPLFYTAQPSAHNMYDSQSLREGAVTKRKFTRKRGYKDRFLNCETMEWSNDQVILSESNITGASLLRRKSEELKK